MSHTSIDITREVCPMTWVRVKLRLEMLQPGDTLEVLLTGDEPLRNLPRNVRDEGHHVRSLERLDDGTARLVVELRGA
jgi:tRNA 2-thiouridine synthesizing protein A